MDTTDVSRAPVHAKVYTDLDVAAAAGLMPEKLSAIPSWCDQNFLAFVAGSQVITSSQHPVQKSLHRVRPMTRP